MGNLSNARFTPENPDAYADNYLIEKPQYAFSYNDNLKSPNWASYQLNQSWLGTSKMRRSNWGADPEFNIPLITFPDLANLA
ncbi:DNA/RNA non-specific endonuclease [Chondrocystis sp. NIES-4102]|nr:DNA/RNA non-specific endonuclease [Chondrocystis sp. NIES-4102]